MADKFYIIHGLNEFNAAPYGILRLVDGKVELDEPKAFNRSRRMLDAGCNLFRRLRTCPVEWGAPVKFDWEDEGYFPLLRRYCEIMHNPVQAVAAKPAGRVVKFVKAALGITPPGAGVWLELFDGCSEDWMLDPKNYAKARALIRRFFAELGDLPFVYFGVGNEMNQEAARAFVRDVVYPEFKAAGRVPFSYGGHYTPDGRSLEWQKSEAEVAWHSEDVMLQIFRQVHSIRDGLSRNLQAILTYWVDRKNRIKVVFSVDGVFDGAHPEDFAVNSKGKVHRRPSMTQLHDALRTLFSRMPYPTLAGGGIKYGFEWISKVVNRDDITAQAIAVIAAEVERKYGAKPANFGRYPDDWKEPAPTPEPTPTPEPELPQRSAWWPWVVGAVGLVLLAIVVAFIF